VGEVSALETRACLYINDSTTSDLIVNIGEKDEAAGMNDSLQASAVPSSSLLRGCLILPTDSRDNLYEKLLFFKPEMEFLDNNLKKDSSLLLHAIHNLFNRTGGFKKPYHTLLWF
jgi:hypothetical protein